MVTATPRIAILAACGFGLAACSSMPAWMQQEPPPPPRPSTVALQIESQPAGAEAQLSSGQTCKTPCSIEVPPAELSVSFSLRGYQPQTVPIRVIDGDTGEPRAPGTGQPGDRLDPNPVSVTLNRVAPRRAAPRPAPQAAPRAAPSAPASRPAARPAPMAPAAPVPEAAPASPWPPPPAPSER